MSFIHSEILEIVQNAPGIGPGEVADMLGQDKSYVRRVMKDMAAKGRIRAEVNGNGYAFFPVNGGAAMGGFEVPRDAFRTAHRANSASANPAPITEILPPSHTTNGATTPSTSLSLVPSSAPAMPQYMPGDPRGRALGQPQYGAWEIKPRANGFRAFDDDPAELGHAYDMLEKQAIREGVAALYGEKAALQNQLAAERRAHAEELTAVKEAADKDALFSSMTRMMTGSAPLEPVHAEKPKSLLQEARAQRVAEREYWQDYAARAAEKRRAKQEAYEDLDQEDAPPELYEDVSEPDDDLDTEPKPSAAAPPRRARSSKAVLPFLKQKPPTASMSLSTKWGIAAVVVAGIALLAKFGGGLAA